MACPFIPLPAARRMRSSRAAAGAPMHMAPTRSAPAVRYACGTD